MEKIKIEQIMERVVARYENNLEQALSGFVTPYLKEKGEEGSRNRFIIGFCLLFTRKFKYDLRREGLLKLLLEEEKGYAEPDKWIIEVFQFLYAPNTTLSTFSTQLSDYSIEDYLFFVERTGDSVIAEKICSWQNKETC
ncbi:hypothetical protein [Listeria costaricensis]|uniref:hypothetical protein n=1 Tax=Listeria costaricensis TaxID=2026604 RepID=UPI0013C4090D|nr:hypothetical protein [Listeria costaricensis]